MYNHHKKQANKKMNTCSSVFSLFSFARPKQSKSNSQCTSLARRTRIHVMQKTRRTQKRNSNNGTTSEHALHSLRKERRKPNKLRMKTMEEEDTEMYWLIDTFNVNAHSRRRRRSRIRTGIRGKMKTREKEHEQ